MSDLTLLYYTDNRMNEESRKKIQDYLMEVTEGQYPVVSVSQKPIDFGKNICVGEIGKSKYNMYKQVLIGAREINTKYVACIDDDTLYSKSHFLHRPEPKVFWYETNYWLALPEWDYYWRVLDHRRKGGGMWGCVSQTQTLLDNMENRFRLYPEDPLDKPEHKSLIWGEPAILDKQFNWDDSFIRGYSSDPCVVFIHRDSMGFNQFRKFHRRYGYPPMENRTYSLEQFGNIKDLFITYFGEN